MDVRERVAYCGLVCEGCPIRWATLENDPAKQAKICATVVRLCEETPGTVVPAEESVFCDGCRTLQGKLFGGCSNCPFRTCAREKRLESCAFCDEYPCDELRKFHTLNPDARSRLEVIRSVGGPV